ncbi:MAG: hypothetical protein BWY54_00809 [Candidatus Dependentiae bacterium ADurb.Bin331]|nr:MAG: hypothetical protein BWY54_00809 [Candidatus Dependentiae bacterium ADurb.Bin331]
MKKIALSFLTILHVQSCAAQLIDLRSALNFFSENKLVTTLCALGVGAIYFGKVVENNRKVAETNIKANQPLIDLFKNRNETKISIYASSAKAKKIEQSNFSTDEFEKMKKECNKEAKRVANLIGTKDYPFTPSTADVPQNMSNQFYHLRFVPGYIMYEGKSVNCTNIEQKERFCCWVPEIAYTLGGVSLFGAGVLVASKFATK